MSSFDSGLRRFESKDYEGAFSYFKRAVDRHNHPEAQFYLGLMYSQGRGVPVNYSKALKWFKLAADQDDADAKFRIGDLYADGLGVLKDNVTAFIWYRAAAMQGHAGAQLALGDCYQFGLGVPIDSEKAFEFYNYAAKQGDPDAQYAIGYCYRTGRGVIQDFRQAIKWFRLAAKSNQSDAATSLGDLHREGQGVSQNFTKALMYYRNAAELENPHAQICLGNMFRLGQGTAIDYRRAMKWFQSASDLGETDGQYLLAEHHLYGWGVPQDIGRAIVHLQVAANGGNVKAQLKLAEVWRESNGVASSEVLHYFTMDVPVQAFSISNVDQPLPDCSHVALSPPVKLKHRGPPACGEGHPMKFLYYHSTSVFGNCNDECHFCKFSLRECRGYKCQKCDYHLCLDCLPLATSDVGGLVETIATGNLTNLKMFLEAPNIVYYTCTLSHPLCHSKKGNQWSCSLCQCKYRPRTHRRWRCKSCDFNACYTCLPVEPAQLLPPVHYTYKFTEGKQIGHHFSLLHFAVTFDKPEVVKMLMAFSANIEAIEGLGSTPLSLAVMMGKTHLVQLLLSYGANKDTQDDNRRTPLFKAVQRSHFDIVHLLIYSGADPSIPDSTGMTALNLALTQDSKAIIDLLRETSRDVRPNPSNSFSNESSESSEINCFLPHSSSSTDDATLPSLLPNLMPRLLTSPASLHMADEPFRPLLHRKSSPPIPPPGPPRTRGPAPPSSPSSSGTPLIPSLGSPGPPRTRGPAPPSSPSSSGEPSPPRPNSLPSRGRAGPPPPRAFLSLSMTSQPSSEVNPITTTLSPSDSNFPTNLLIPVENLTIEASYFAKSADGVVFRAKYLGTAVAVKKLFYFDEVLQKELKKWCHFRHQNILQLIGFSQPVDAPPFIIMEMMDQSLFDLLKNHTIDLSWQVRLNMAYGIAAGLVYLHVQNQLIHQDIKSLNILVKSQGTEVKIADSGASRAKTALTSNTAGTYGWLAPELYENHTFSFAVDIYALGITLNELLTRQIPFSEFGDNDVAIMKAVSSNQRPKMDPYPSVDIPPLTLALFTQLIQRCWHQDPLQRPSATSILEHLKTIIQPPIPTSSSSIIPSFHDLPRQVSSSSNRDPTIVTKLNALNVSVTVQNKLFEEEALDLSTVSFFTTEILKRCGLPEAKANLVLQHLQAISSSPSSPSPVPSSISSQTVIVIRHAELLYDQHRPLARGAFGCVYDSTFKGQRVAVKTLFAQTESKELKEFMQESEAMTSLCSPFLVRLIGITLDPQTMVMEFMEGGSLFDLLHRKTTTPLNWCYQCDILSQIAQGIEYLHSQKVVHRDLKSGNILLSGDHKRVKLADFGLSRRCDEIGQAQTSTSMAGTVPYMAPELFTSTALQSSRAADVYAYGIIMWEVAFRAIPWQHAKDFETVKRNVKDNKLRPIIDENVGHSTDFIELMIQCWTQEADQRPRMEMVIQSLKNCESIAPGTKPYRAPSQLPSIHYDIFDSQQFAFGTENTPVCSFGPSSSSSSSSGGSVGSLLSNPGQVEGEWTVRKWLQSLGLIQYCGIFEENAETKEDVKNLTMEELKTDLGIASLSHRKNILKYAAFL